MTINRIILFLSIFIMYVAGVQAATLDGLRVEYEHEPLGIDVEAPRFSWLMKGDVDEYGPVQKAYRIVVKDESDRQLWDSGCCVSASSLNVTYAGQKLVPQTRYRWMLTVWDGKGRTLKADSWFETGLMDSSYAAWNGARWIGLPADRLPLYSHYLPVFKLSYTLRLNAAAHSTKAAFIFGANDRRLMNPNMNIYGLRSAKDSSFISVELDTAPLDKGGKAVINIGRKGYSPADSEGIKIIKTLTVSSDLINKTNRYKPFHFVISANLGVVSVSFGSQNNTLLGTVDLNPLGQGGDFVAFPVVGDVGISVSCGQKASLSDVEVLSYRSPSAPIARVESLTLNDVSDRMITVNPSRGAMPMLRTAFNIPTGVSKARLYVTARGVYDVYINGRRVGNDDRLNPGFSQYDRTQPYQTFDVTSLLRTGDNALGAVLGEGWWSGNMTYEGRNWNYFGDRQSLLAMLVITCSDGTRQTMVSDPQGWRCFDGGPYVYGSLFQGEVYDATREEVVNGWTEPAFDDSTWPLAAEISAEGTTSKEGWGHGHAPDDYTAMRFSGLCGPSVRPVERLHAVAVEEVSPGVFVYDMGQNLAGVPVIEFSGLARGSRVTMRYAEVKYPDLPEYKAHKGMLMLENIRAAMATDVYTACGKDRETFSPRFTYHGYRYIELTGIDHALPLTSVCADVLSSIHGLTADYNTSDTLVNRLWKNICWSAKANFFSVPTDCPQRNERLGWAGDISVFSRTATYLADVPQFLRRYLRAMRDVQTSEGRMPDIAPLGGGFGGFLWGSAGITVPWECFRQYADTVLLGEHYEAMNRYMDYVAAKYIDPATNLIVQERQWGDLGDWLGLEDSKNDKSLLWECYYIYDLDIMSRVAAVLGKPADSARYAALRDERRKLFRATYLDESGRTVASAFVPGRKGKPVDTQTSYVLALATGAVDDEIRPKVVSRLAATLTRTNTMDSGKEAPPYSLMTGFIGTSWISKVLSDNGLGAEAYKLLLNTEYPSWLYPVTQGATTIWERLNSYTLKDGFGGNNRMNSFNHYSFGAVGSWMINYSLGIRRDDAHPGFSHFILQPEPDPTGKMTSAHGHYDSMYGRIESGWRQTATGTDYHFTVPANTTATLRLPASSLKGVYENGHRLKKKVYRAEAQPDRGVVNMILPSGTYRFTVMNGK